MGKYLAKRLIQIFILMVIYITVVFFILEAMPGKITDKFLSNPKVTPEARKAIERLFGLDKPIHVRYFKYLINSLTFKFGVSFDEFPRPVWDIIKERLPRTLFLFTIATLISYSVGYNLGKHIAWRRGKIADNVALGVGIVTWTIFYPLLALLLIWLFGVELRVVPFNQFITPEFWANAPEGVNAHDIFVSLLINGFIIIFAWLVALIFSLRLQKMSHRKIVVNTTLFSAFVISILFWALAPIGPNGTKLGSYALDIIAHMVLPVMTLTIISFAGSMLVMRDSMLEIIKEDYITTALAKGLPEKIVRDKHAARTALLPLVTNFVLSLGATVSGGIITETMFSWPGMGKALLDAVLIKDFPVAIGCFVFTGYFILFAHLVADILYAFLDPRIRY